MMIIGEDVAYFVVSSGKYRPIIILGRHVEIIIFKSLIL